MTERTYIEYDNARITLREDFLLDLELYSGLKYSGLEARRLFPITGGDKYITLLDADKNEVAIIRDVDTLMKESAEAVREALRQYYVIPKISRITHIEEKYGTIRVDADTDHGSCHFEVGDRNHGIKVMFDGRILIRDTDDNRYEIPDMGILDRRAIDIFLI